MRLLQRKLFCSNFQQAIFGCKKNMSHQPQRTSPEFLREKGAQLRYRLQNMDYHHNFQPRSGDTVCLNLTVPGLTPFSLSWFFSLFYKQSRHYVAILLKFGTCPPWLMTHVFVLKKLKLYSLNNRTTLDPNRVDILEK